MYGTHIYLNFFVFNMTRLVYIVLASQTENTSDI